MLRNFNKMIEKIKAEMTKQGVSNYRLAKLTGLAESTIGRILSEKVNPNYASLKKMCQALKIEI